MGLYGEMVGAVEAAGIDFPLRPTEGRGRDVDKNKGVTFTPQTGASEVFEESRGVLIIDRVELKDILAGTDAPTSGINTCLSDDMNHGGGAEVGTIWGNWAGVRGWEEVDVREEREWNHQ